MKIIIIDDDIHLNSIIAKTILSHSLRGEDMELTYVGDTIGKFKATKQIPQFSSHVLNELPNFQPIRQNFDKSYITSKQLPKKKKR